MLGSESYDLNEGGVVILFSAEYTEPGLGQGST
jgi:hypothetical protein